ncbi:MAG: Gfo/Idh/MocA family oxidoreductase [Ruminococcaceae bacterium]|nr:Gfo/Idh/MocA family oxidoreductase [Oscillospiraceae bacterium]
MAKRKLNVGFIGHSGRGSGLLNLLLEMEDVKVVGVCDLYEDRMESAKQKVIDKYGKEPVASKDYHDILAIKGIDAVITPSAWVAHVDICIDAMNAGIAVASEVGGAYSINQLWELVRTHEKTGVPCMLLENCCYGKKEMAVLNMVKKGLFGELIHAEGGYRHDLREEIGLGDRNRHYRQGEYTARNGELYPTHELGPIAKNLNINRGNRMISLTAMASKSRGIVEWAKTNRTDDDVITNRVFNQGDIVQTMIKCANGETILLTHDTSLPRPYSRANVLQGTKGIWSEDCNGIYFDGVSPEAHKWEVFDTVYEKYCHPLWTEFENDGVKGGHGGMDWLVLRAFVESIKSGKKPPIDVYDMAAWMAVTCLSEESIALGSAPVAIPDFTNGKWIKREAYDKGKYCLEEVDESLFK